MEFLLMVAFLAALKFCTWAEHLTPFTPVPAGNLKISLSKASHCYLWEGWSDRNYFSVTGSGTHNTQRQ